MLVHGRRPDDFFKDVRSSAPDAIIDVHHPRIDAEIGYFDLGQFDARGDRAGRAGFSWDFDHLVTATGNSDTHHLSFNIGGYPRNYVKLRDDQPDHVDPRAVAAAIKFHHAFFTTAPFVTLEVNGGTIGDLVPARGGDARADITVQAAPLVSVSRVTMYLNGVEAKRWTVPAGTGAVRFHDSIDVHTARDGYVVVRVEATSR